MWEGTVFTGVCLFTHGWVPRPGGGGGVLARSRHGGGALARSRWDWVPPGQWWGTPIQIWGTHPSQVRMVYPPLPQPGQDGVPSLARDGVLPSPGQGSRWSTWYAAGGMPFAFTQEDFLVLPLKITSNTWSKIFCCDVKTNDQAQNKKDSIACN